MGRCLLRDSFARWSGGGYIYSWEVVTSGWKRNARTDHGRGCLSKSLKKLPGIGEEISGSLGYEWHTVYQESWEARLPPLLHPSYLWWRKEKEFHQTWIPELLRSTYMPRTLPRPTGRSLYPHLMEVYQMNTGMCTERGLPEEAFRFEICSSVCLDFHTLDQDKPFRRRTYVAAAGGGSIGCSSQDWSDSLSGGPMEALNTLLNYKEGGENPSSFTGQLTSEFFLHLKPANCLSWISLHSQFNQLGTLNLMSKITKPNICRVSGIFSGQNSRRREHFAWDHWRIRRLCDGHWRLGEPWYCWLSITETGHCMHDNPGIAAANSHAVHFRWGLLPRMFSVRCGVWPHSCSTGKILIIYHGKNCWRAWTVNLSADLGFLR